MYIYIYGVYVHILLMCSVFVRFDEADVACVLHTLSMHFVFRPISYVCTTIGPRVCAASCPCVEST